MGHDVDTTFESEDGIKATEQHFSVVLFITL